MTSFEHVMLGVNGTVAAGLHERHGWKIVAIAGVAAASPDLDGVTWLISNEAFSIGHRVWGHNVLTCLLLGILIGVLDYRFDFVTRVGRHVTRILRLRVAEYSVVARERWDGRSQRIWVLVAIVATFSQLPADLAVSGTKTLPIWGLKLLWPFSDAEWSFQMVTYNDPGAIFVFIAGMFAMTKWTARSKQIARVTLLLVATYLWFRGFVWHEPVFGA